MTTRALEGRVIVVTGAGGLIGARVAQGLVAEGARVVAADLDPARCAALVSDDVLVAEVDVAAPASVDALRDAALTRFDRVDGVFHAAAIDDKVAGADATARGLPRFDAASFRATVDVNVTGTFLVSQTFGAYMAARGGGSIVNTASTYALVAPDPALYVDPSGARAHVKSPAYVASKGAVIALTRHLAAELGPFGVRANALTPGGVRAAQPAWFVEAYARRTPLARMASADDLVGAVVYLLSDASRYVTGTNLVVDGGYTLC